MKDNSYIVLQSFMRSELNLKGNELMVYALIYGFCQDEENEFAGSVGYIAEWLGTSKQTVHTVLNKLIEKQLVEKTESYINGVKFCKYKTLPVVKKFDGGSQKTLHNNINNITSNNLTISQHKVDVYKDIVNEFNYICARMSKVERITESRKKHIKARLASNSREEITIAFHKANESDFLCGVNDRGWKADFDWLMKNDSNITKVLEGKYDNKTRLTKTDQAFVDAYNSIRGDANDNRTFFDE